MNVTRPERPRCAGAQCGTPWLRAAAPDCPFFQPAAGHGERVCRTAMVMEAGLLARQSAQQPDLAVTVLLQQGVPPLVRVIAHAAGPRARLAGKGADQPAQPAGLVLVMRGRAALAGERRELSCLPI
jgi:hypothetical protein